MDELRTLWRDILDSLISIRKSELLECYQKLRLTTNKAAKKYLSERIFALEGLIDELYRLIAVYCDG